MLEFEIVPFEGALPLTFGLYPTQVSGLIGAPQFVMTTGGDLSHHYNPPITSLIVGFGGEGQTADHFGFGRGAVVRFRGLDFFADRTSWRHLVDQSLDYHECLGFLVFCDLGIALTGFHDDYEDELAVIVFPRGEWEKYRSKFKPFELPGGT